MRRHPRVRTCVSNPATRRPGTCRKITTDSPGHLTWGARTPSGEAKGSFFKSPRWDNTSSEENSSWNLRLAYQAFPLSPKVPRNPQAPLRIRGDGFFQSSLEPDPLSSSGALTVSPYPAEAARSHAQPRRDKGGGGHHKTPTLPCSPRRSCGETAGSDAPPAHHTAS